MPTLPLFESSPSDPGVVAAGLADRLTTIEQALTVGTRDDALRALTQLAVRQVPGADHAGITIGNEGRFRSVAETDSVVARTDRIQYELGSGPCVDAIIEDTTFNASDLRTDARWPIFGRRAYHEVGVISMLSFRLFVEDDRESIAALNMYSCRMAAFDRTSETSGVLLATAGALALAGVAARDRANNLQIALGTSREIGIAIGVLMSEFKVTRDQGFDLLRVASQATHRKLADLAHEVAETGVLPELPVRGPRH